MMALAVASFIAIFFFAAPFPLIVLAAAIIGYAGGRSGQAAGCRCRDDIGRSRTDSRPALPAGVLGGALTTWVTFAPCFLWIFLFAPFVERLRENRALSAGLTAITAAVVGVVLNLALWFALHTVFGTVERFEAWGRSVAVPQPETLNLWALGLSAAALVGAFGFRIGAVPLLAGGSSSGTAIGRYRSRLSAAHRLLPN